MVEGVHGLGSPDAPPTPRPPAPSTGTPQGPPLPLGASGVTPAATARRGGGARPRYAPSGPLRLAAVATPADKLLDLSLFLPAHLHVLNAVPDRSDPPPLGLGPRVVHGGGGPWRRGGPGRARANGFGDLTRRPRWSLMDTDLRSWTQRQSKGDG